MVLSRPARRRASVFGKRPPASTGPRLHRPLALEDGACCPLLTTTGPLLLMKRMSSSRCQPGPWPCLSWHRGEESPLALSSPVQASVPSAQGIKSPQRKGPQKR